MKNNPLLIIIFVLAIVIRFLYFPNNIYFGYDQARDAYSALDITKGDIQIVGPTTSFKGLNHGVLYYYLLAPIYFLSGGNPVAAAAMLRILNALGVFLIFYLGKIIFGSKNVGLFAALLFAVSFEQTQFSIYMGNPTLASLTVPLMYLGLAMVIFSNNKWGLPLALLGLGFSIQFEFSLIYLVIPFVLIILTFFKSFLKTSLRILAISFFALILSLSTFIVSELKYNFRMIKTFLEFSKSSSGKTADDILSVYGYTVSTISSFNIWGDLPLNLLVLLIILLLFLFLLVKRKEIREQLIFLAIWFFSLILIFTTGGPVDLKKNTPLYYTYIGVSTSLSLFVAYLISQLFNINKFLAGALIALVIWANLGLIVHFNPKGTIKEINVQQGMLLKDEQRILDLIYQDAGSDPFATKAITMPFYINTTWSYLFEWYGKNKYGPLPIWGEKNAQGYPGNLVVNPAQDSLPSKRYLIIEPVRGIPYYLVDDYLRIEGYFTTLEWEKEIGLFKLQKRARKN